MVEFSPVVTLEEVAFVLTRRTSLPYLICRHELPNPNTLKFFCASGEEIGDGLWYEQLPLPHPRSKVSLPGQRLFRSPYSISHWLSLP